MHDLEVGQLVVATAGRDKSNKFIVMCIIDNEYVYISDGDLRKVENPKKKKTKHIRKLNYISEDIKNKLQRNEKVTNREVKKFISTVVSYREQEV